MKPIRPLFLLVFAAVAIAPATAAQTSILASTHTQAARHPKANFYDAWITGRMKTEKLDTSATAMLRQAHALETSRGAGITSQTRAAELYEQFLTRYPKSPYALEVRRNLIPLLSALYAHDDDPIYRDREFEVAREGLHQVDELAAQHPDSEYLEWLRGEYLSPLMSLGGNAAPETIERVHKFYLKAQEDPNLADSARIMIFYRLIDIALNQRNFDEATNVIKQGEALAAKMASGKDAASKSIGETGRVSFLFLAAKTGILKGDSKATKAALDRIRAEAPADRLKAIERALILVRKRVNEAKPPAKK